MVENSLNILHYCIYRVHYNLHLLFNKINPLRLIHKLPFQKRRYEELGIDIDKEINKAFGDKRYGLSTIVAGGAIVSILFLLMMALVFLTIKAAGSNLKLSPIHFVLAGLLSWIVCHFIVFKGDKYIRYFKAYDKWTRKEKTKYGWASFLFTVTAVVLFFWSLTL
jgi:hypothetical protein